MGWRQMAAEAPSGPKVRLAMDGYAAHQRDNTDAPGRGRLA
jgi:hypothetical protein